MYVHADVKERRRRVGWAADLCPICRDLRAFEVLEVRKVARVYLVPLGAGTLEGREIVCVDCGTVLPAPEEGYARVSRRRRDAARLVEATNPGVLDRSESWFDRQRRVARGRLSAPERIEEIRGVLASLEHMAGRRAGGGPEEWVAALSVVAFFVLLFGAVLAWTPAVGASGPWRWALTAGAAGMLVVGAILVHGHPAMAARRHLMPRLVRALEPLEPSLEELEAALASARRDGLRVGRVIGPRRVHEALNRERRRPVVLAPPGPA